MPSWSASAWLVFAVVGQLSQALPTPSLSPSTWSVFTFAGQLSQTSPIVSSSASAVWIPSTFGQRSLGQAPRFGVNVVTVQAALDAELNSSWRLFGYSPVRTRRALAQMGASVSSPSVALWQPGSRG